MVGLPSVEKFEIDEAAFDVGRHEPDLDALADVERGFIDFVLID